MGLNNAPDCGPASIRSTQTPVNVLAGPSVVSGCVSISLVSFR